MPTEWCERWLPGREVLLCVSQEATGWINIHVEQQQQMPQSPSNAHFSLPIHSHPLVSYHLLTPYISHPSLLLPFLPPLMKSTPHLLYPSLSISLSLIYLPFLYSLPMLSPILFYSPSLAFFSFILLLFSSCRPPASPGSCLSSVFARCISRLFLWRESCVCSPPYCVI